MNSAPLIDVLPWGFKNPPSEGRTILICDSHETDGRFLLHTIASQCLSSRSDYHPSVNTSVHSSSTSPAGNPAASASIKKEPFKIIWIHCGMKTNANILAAMRKIGCDLRLNEDMVDIIPILAHFSQPEGQTQQKNSEEGPDSGSEQMNDENYLKSVYRSLKQITNSNAKYTIIIDNCSLMSTFFGAALTYGFITKLRSLVRNGVKQGKDTGLVILASHDSDQENYIHSTDQQGQNKSVAGSKQMHYIGAGGRGVLHDTEAIARLEQDARYELGEMVWERSLVELADGVVDVVPLASGFAKDVHGRIVFTSRIGAGRGWKREDDASSARSNNHFLSSMVNYRCTDGGIRAIRLRVGS